MTANGNTRHNQQAAPAGQVTRWHTDQHGHRRITACLPSLRSKDQFSAAAKRAARSAAPRPALVYRDQPHHPP
jgi:hypothetical protein